MSEIVSQVEPDSELPHPQDDPDIKYLHVGKQYKTPHGDIIEITAYDPDGPADGVIAFEFVEGGNGRHEHERSEGGVRAADIESYIEKYDGYVQTATMTFKDIKELRLLEVDRRSYADLFYNRVDKQVADEQ
jgi:hypothetical protein